MTKAPKRPRDLNQWAKRMVDIATGDQPSDKSDKPALKERAPTPASKPKPPQSKSDC